LSKPSLGVSAARGAALTLVTQIARLAVQFVSLIVLARLLVPEDFGLVAMVLAVVGVAEIIREFGLSAAAMQAPELSRSQQTNLFWINLSLGLVCAVVAIGVSPLIARLYGDDRLVAVTQVLAIVFLLGGANAQFRASLSRDLKFSALTLSELGASIAGVVVALILAMLGFGYGALVGQQIVTAAVLLVLNFVQSNFRPGLPKRLVGTRKLLGFGSSVAGTQAISYIGRNADNFMIGLVWGPVSLGLYSRAFQFLMLPINQINVPMTRIALPVLSKIQGERDRFQSYIQKAQLVSAYVTTSIFAVAAGLADPLLTLLLGSEWVGIAPIFAVLAIGGVFRALNQVSYWIFLSRGFAGAQLRYSALATPVLIAAMAAGLPWGPVGVAAGHSIGYFFYWLFGLQRACKVADVERKPLFALARRSTCIVSIPSGLICFGITQVIANSMLQIGVSLICVGLYNIVVLFVCSSVRNDAEVIFGFVRKAIKR